MPEPMHFTSGSRSQNAAVRVSELARRVSEVARRQFGVIAWWQLKRLGIGDATVTRWRVAGRLHRLLPGVYAVGHRSV
jgi:hypothetical protein